jgi:hypothetical protein
MTNVLLEQDASHRCLKAITDNLKKFLVTKAISLFY